MTPTPWAARPRRTSLAPRPPRGGARGRPLGLAIAGLFATVAGACAGKDGAPGLERVHDPSRVFERDGQLWLLSSGTDGRALQSWMLDLQGSGRLIRGVGVDYDDLVGDDVADISPWNPSGELDAPALSADGKRLYYSTANTDPGRIQNAIGMAEWVGGTWVPGGLVLESVGEDDTTPRAMDPSLVSTEDGPVLVFGSHAGGVYATALDPSTGLLLDEPDRPHTADAPERFVSLAQNPVAATDPLSGIEAPFMVEQDGVYTLFFNVGWCCMGSDSTTEVRMGQSASPFGPFLDRDGVPLTDGGGSTFLVAEGMLHGPGQVGVAEVAGEQLLTMHVYDEAQDGRSELVVRELDWDAEGWPVAGAVILAP